MARLSTNALYTRRTVLAMGVGCVALCLGAVTGCSNYPSVEDALKNVSRQPTVSTAATMQSGVLTVGLNANSAPFSWPVTVGQDRVLQGVDIDMALAMGDAMGLEVAFVDVQSNTEAAAQGLCDVVMGVTQAQLPGTEVLVGNYLETAPAVFGKNVVATVTVEQLASAAVGVQNDSVSARALAAMAPTAVLTPYGTLNDAFSALEANSVQYVACDSFMGGYLATSYPDISLAGALSLPETRGVAVAATNVELQNAVRVALDSVAASGEQQSIRESWVGNLPIINSSNQITPPATTEPAPEAVPVEGEGGEEPVA